MLPAMPDRSRKKRPHEPVASVASDRARTGEPITEPSLEEVRAAARALGRRGGLVGGKARASKLSAEKRSEIAQRAARARWGRKSTPK